MNVIIDIWIQDLLSKLNRKNAEILFSNHAANDKNLTITDVDCAVKTVRRGKIYAEKSNETKKRICFKLYFKATGNTYFVITEYCHVFIMVVTVIKKRGKY